MLRVRKQSRRQERVAGQRARRAEGGRVLLPLFAEALLLGPASPASLIEVRKPCLVDGILRRSEVVL